MNTRSLLLAFLLLVPASAAAQDSLVHELNLSEECRDEFYGVEHHLFDTDEPEGRITVITPAPISRDCKAEIVRSMMAHPNRPDVLFRPGMVRWYDNDKYWWSN